MSLHKAINLSDVKRREADFYATPSEVTQAFLGVEADKLRAFESVWEPAAGDGAIVSDLLDVGGIRVYATDAIDRQSKRIHVCNFYEYQRPLARAVVTNPPFADCSGEMPWLWHSHRLGLEYMALLLPSGWPYASGRRAFLSAWPIAREWKVGWRIDWTGGGASPANHSWYVWDTRAAASDSWRTGVLYRDDIATQPSLFAESTS